MPFLPIYENGNFRAEKHNGKWFVVGKFANDKTDSYVKVKSESEANHKATILNQGIKDDNEINARYNEKRKATVQNYLVNRRSRPQQLRFL